MARGLPTLRELIGELEQEAGLTATLPGGPIDEVLVGSSPKIARAGFGGGKISRGGFGCGAIEIVLPGWLRPVIGFCWLLNAEFRLMFSLLKIRSSGAPMWMSPI